MQKVIKFSVIAIFSLFGLYLLTTVSTKLLFNQPTLHYSEGERIGVLRKFSKKGLIWKTYEGELMLNAEMGSVKLDTFLFSVENQSTADSITLYIGEKVKLKYNQYLVVPYSIGSTSYIIYSVEKIE